MEKRLKVAAQQLSVGAVQSFLPVSCSQTSQRESVTGFLGIEVHVTQTAVDIWSHKTSKAAPNAAAAPTVN